MTDKDDNVARRKIGRQDGFVFNWFDYKHNQTAVNDPGGVSIHPKYEMRSKP